MSQAHRSVCAKGNLALRPYDAPPGHPGKYADCMRLSKQMGRTRMFDAAHGKQESKSGARYKSGHQPSRLTTAIKLKCAV